MSSYKNIFLIRHGETEWNQSKRLNSFTDIPLSDVGERQINELSDSFSNVIIDHAFSSPLLRAKMTADIICKARSIKIIVDENLKEASFGIYEGKSAVVLESDKQSNDFSKWRDGEIMPPELELEPLRDVANRASSFLSFIEALEGNILVSSHGYFIRVLLASNVLGLDVRDFKKIWLSNGSCSIVLQQDKVKQIRLLNATKFDLEH